MRNHVLCNFSETISKQPHPHTIYDFTSQISYFDSNCTRRVIGQIIEMRQATTIMTETIENTDSDNLYGEKSTSPFSPHIKHCNNSDYSLLVSTNETRCIETSDADNVYGFLTTTTTFTVENTDKDH